MRYLPHGGKRRRSAALLDRADQPRDTAARRRQACRSGWRARCGNRPTRCVSIPISTPPSPAVPRRVRAAARRGSTTRSASSTANCTNSATATRSRSGRATTWSAGSMAWRSAARSSARACSRPPPTPRRSRLLYLCARLIRRRLHPARHAVRHRASAPVRHRRGRPAGIPRRARASDAAPWRLSDVCPSMRRHADHRHHRGARASLTSARRAPTGADGGSAAADRRCRRPCWPGGALWPRVCAGWPHSVSQTSNTGCSTALRPGLSANIQPENSRLTLAVELGLVDLDEARRLRRLGRRARVADARRHLQRAELHRSGSSGTSSFEIRAVTLSRVANTAT